MCESVKFATWTTIAAAAAITHIYNTLVSSIFIIFLFQPLSKTFLFYFSSAFPLLENIAITWNFECNGFIEWNRKSRNSNEFLHWCRKWRRRRKRKRQEIQQINWRIEWKIQQFMCVCVCVCCYFFATGALHFIYLFMFALHLCKLNRLYYDYCHFR